MNEPILATASSLRSLAGVPATFRIAGMVLLGAHTGAVRFTLPDGRQVQFRSHEDGPQAEITIRDYRFIRRALAAGDVGFGEAYMDGDWSTPDLTEVLRYFSANFDRVRRLSAGGSIVRALNMLRHVFQNENTREGAKKNIIAHYDLGNDFYSGWLDSSMTYSSALFSSPNQSLEHGQQAKYAAICDLIGVGPESRLLEIGCGWGGFAEYAARHRGAHVTALTISPSQRDFALARLQRAGLSDRVDIRLEDYRDHKGRYDGIASIEMFEAVGESYWPSYFGKIRECLKDDARAALQIITIEDDLFPRYRKRVDFIQRHIFPGGMLPSDAALKAEFARAQLKFESVHWFGRDYARTCREWSRRFNQVWPQIERQGFSEPFRNLWNFYLSYCEAGFLDGRINVGQYQIARA